MEIGERLRAIRIARNLSIYKACKLGNIDQSSLQSIETGRTKGPTVNTLIKLCKVYNVPPSYVLGLDNIKWEIEPKWASLIKELESMNMQPRQVYKIVNRYNKRPDKFQI